MHILAAGLSCLLVLQMGTTSLSAQADSDKLNLIIVEGEGAINNVRQRTAREPIVQVEDQNHKPVAGAAVVFLLPDHGASGVFANGSRTLTVMSDAQGRAVARGFHPNNVQGNLQMRVTASSQGRVASVTISQTNAVAGAAAGAAVGAGISAKLLIILAVAGAAVAGGVVAATHNGGSSTPPVTPTTVTPGSGTVGAPH